MKQPAILYEMRISWLIVAFILGTVGLASAYEVDPDQYIDQSFVIDEEAAPPVAVSRPEKGWLGLSIQSVDKNFTAALGGRVSNGALVADVVSGGPADRGGVKVGDIILDFAGNPVATATDLAGIVADYQPGSRVTLIVWRDGRKWELDLTVGIKAAFKNDRIAAAEKAAADFGITFDWSKKDSREFGLKVVDVKDSSPAAASGLLSGDVIMQAGQKDIDSAVPLCEILDSGAKQNKPVLLLVKRQKSNLFLVFRFGVK
ncbi:PDZ domain-containing protein [Maridesulfovibrio sp.]|uniref:PDZ domain-containing protein n=1 Tax=Maridesulfovibrio sp. TaxID=2795000 RepID=UPI002A18B89F|nr:PDZ domain-containing protein [Maridesulfovibrio sp.]